VNKCVRIALGLCILAASLGDFSLKCSRSAIVWCRHNMCRRARFNDVREAIALHEASAGTSGEMVVERGSYNAREERALDWA